MAQEENSVMIKTENRMNAFTFAELMVSLVIIAVITALLYPTITELSPNNNKQLFRSAYKTVELTVQDIITSPINSANRDAFGSSADLCLAFKDRLNTVGWSGVAPSTGEAAPSYSGCDNGRPMELRTSNGMRWWFQYYKDGVHTIYVDVNASNNSSNFESQACGAAAGQCNGDLADPTTAPTLSTVWPNGSFRVNNSTMRDTFKIQIRTDGKVIIDNDTVGASHLRDETE